MEQTLLKLDREAFSCAICLDLLKSPVTTACGHSYCMKCLQSHWDGEDQKGEYSCPQCRQSFAPRPVLVKNTMLAFLVEELKKPGLQEAEGSEPEVSCDLCTGTKQRAAKSCLQCLASYCESHLQPHLDVAVLQKHQLVAPCSNLQDSICSEHNRVQEMFCRTEQQLLCSLCSVEHHKDHDITSAASERAQRQRELEATKRDILQNIQTKETDLELLQQEALSIGRSAQEAVQRSGDSFTALIHLLEQRRAQVEKEIRSQQETQEGAVQQLQDQLQQDVTELRRTLVRLDALALTPDHNQFFKHYPALVKDSKVLGSARIWTSPQPCFKEVMDSVSALTKKLQQVLNKDVDHISLSLSKIQFEHFTRKDFLKYLQDVTLDPNTVNKSLILSEGNKKVTYTSMDQHYPDNLDRFICWWQVLSREGMTGRCYWEVEWSGPEGCRIAVSYKNIKRKLIQKSDSGDFRYNDKSWVLCCDEDGCTFWFNKVKTHVPGPVSNRIGVYLDHSAGALSFYSISETKMTLLHRVQTTFTQPLYAGVGFYNFSYKFLAHLSGHMTAYFPEPK